MATFLGVGALALGIYALAHPSDSGSPAPEGSTAQQSATAEAQQSAPREVEDDKAEADIAQSAEDLVPAFDVDTPDSITVIVNKQRPMDPYNWAPDDLVLPQGIGNEWGHVLRAEAAHALEEMYAGASAAGAPFIITSGYRSYDTQVGLYNSYVARSGQASADTYSARPGFSEHQTGLAVDLHESTAYCYMTDCFEETAAGLWLHEHAAEYGFVLRYPNGESDIVGYKYEPWHFRYVGPEVALAMQDSGEINLETFLGLDAAPNY